LYELSTILRSDVLLAGSTVLIIVFALAITAVLQGSPPPTFSQIITVGPVWGSDVWACTSDADFMIFGTLRGIGDSQITINISGKGTQSLYSLTPGQIETFSIGGEANDQIIITRTGTVTGFLTLQTSSDATASCTQP